VRDARPRSVGPFLDALLSLRLLESEKYQTMVPMVANAPTPRLTSDSVFSRSPLSERSVKRLQAFA
jgi:hypothetical protein